MVYWHQCFLHICKWWIQSSSWEWQEILDSLIPLINFDRTMTSCMKYKRFSAGKLQSIMVHRNATWNCQIWKKSSHEEKLRTSQHCSGRKKKIFLLFLSFFLQSVFPLQQKQNLNLTIWLSGVRFYAQKTSEINGKKCSLFF